MTHTALRDTVLEFSSSFYYESIGIMIKVPGKGESLWRMFVLFSKEIWIFILLVSFVSTFVLYALHKLSPVPLDSEFEHFGNCLWYVFSCMANQGDKLIEYCNYCNYTCDCNCTRSFNRTYNFLLQVENTTQSHGQPRIFWHSFGCSCSFLFRCTAVV